MSETRTPKQSDCLHLWQRQVAKTLNDAGLDQRVVIEALALRGLDAPWTEGSFKENVWKPIQLAMIGEKSTTKAGTTDYNAEYQALCKWFGQEFEVVLPPWPTRFTQGDQE